MKIDYKTFFMHTAIAAAAAVASAYVAKRTGASTLPVTGKNAGLTAADAAIAAAVEEIAKAA